MDYLLIALCRTHDTWDTNTNNSSQPLLRTLRDAVEGNLKLDEEAVEMFNKVVVLLCRNAPHPMNEDDKLSVINLSEEVIWSRAANDDNFCRFLGSLLNDDFPREPRPVVRPMN